jgi:hypothetical protein
LLTTHLDWATTMLNTFSVEPRRRGLTPSFQASPSDAIFWTKARLGNPGPVASQGVSLSPRFIAGRRTGSGGFKHPFAEPRGAGVQVFPDQQWKLPGRPHARQIDFFESTATREQGFTLGPIVERDVTDIVD